MSIISISCIGVAAVLFAVQLKNIKSEYGIYLTLVACLIIMGYGLTRLQSIKGLIEMTEKYLGSDSEYLLSLIRIVGITYVCQFSSDICKDCGYSSVAGQIQIFGKLVILSYSVPIVLAVMDNISNFI